MRPQSLFARLLPLAALGVAAACDGDGGTNTRPRLTPADVQGVYTVCSLRFTPVQNALPAANLLQFIVNPSPPAPKQPPSLTLSGQTAAYQLLYTRRIGGPADDGSGSGDITGAVKLNGSVGAFKYGVFSADERHEAGRERERDVRRLNHAGRRPWALVRASTSELSTLAR